LQRGTRADPADIDLVVFDAADHVHVEHGHGFVEGLGGFLDPRGGTEKAQFLSSE